MIHNHFGAFFLLWQYFPVSVVRKWAEISVPMLEGNLLDQTTLRAYVFNYFIGSCKSTMLALQMAVLVHAAEHQQLLHCAEELAALSDRSIVADVVMEYCMVYVS